MQECCNKEVLTPYCPYCGKPIISKDPLESLLFHVRKQLGTHKGRLQRIKNGRSSPYEGEEEALNMFIEKWRNWESALLEALNRKGEKHETQTTTSK